MHGYDFAQEHFQDGPVIILDGVDMHDGVLRRELR
jgi:hypothetical protein